MSKRVVVVGGGISGMQTALSLKSLGFEPLILEQSRQLGGKVADWHLLFPTFTSAEEVTVPLIRAVRQNGILVRLGCKVVSIESRRVILSSGERIDCDAVVLCSGSTLFDATIKEEYGYGIYDNVYTSADIEKMMNNECVATASGAAPERIAILHCVGSRDEKVCQRHCSKVCCITGVKQAIELKKLFPKAEIFNFYMDIRMFGPGYEELYRQAQIDYNIHFVRGRISEASPLMDGRVQIKAEDTLTGRPLRMTVDMLVLLVGMSPNYENEELSASSGLALAPNGYFRANDSFLGAVRSNIDGIFYVGAATAPKSLADTLAEASMTASAVAEYVNNKNLY